MASFLQVVFVQPEIPKTNNVKRKHEEKEVLLFQKQKPANIWLLFCSKKWIELHRQLRQELLRKFDLLGSTGVPELQEPVSKPLLSAGDEEDLDRLHPGGVPEPEGSGRGPPRSDPDHVLTPDGVLGPDCMLVAKLQADDDLVSLPLLYLQACFAVLIKPMASAADESSRHDVRLTLTSSADPGSSLSF